MISEQEKRELVVQAIGRWPDFPKKDIVFRDVLPLFNQPRALRFALDWFKKQVPSDCTVIVSPESRGFMFGCPVAADLALRFVPARKPGKTPGPLITESYDLEYGSATLCIQEGAIRPGDKVVLIDDILATGGTLKAVSKLVERAQAECIKSICLLDIAEFPHKTLDATTWITF